MYCLSKDGLVSTEAKGFYIEPTKGFLRYYRGGEFKFKTDLETEMYCLFTDNGCLMCAFDTMEEAKEKLKEVMYKMASGTEIFEF